MTITFLNLGEKMGLFGQAFKGDGMAAAKVAQEANMAPISYMLAKDSVSGAGQIWNAYQQGGVQGLHNLGQSSMAATKGILNGTVAKGATCYRFFPSQAVQSHLPGFVKAMDKSLLETGVGRGILSKLGGSAAVTTGAKGASASISGGAAAQIGGRAMARIPVLGIVVSSLFEIPNIVDAFKNGDGMQQLGRSATTVACTTIGTAIGGAIGSLIPIPGLGTVIGGAIGGWLGNKVGKFLGNAIFGKSIKDKMKDGDYARNIMQSYNNLNFGNIGSGQSLYGGNIQTGNYGNYGNSGNYANAGANSAGVNVDETLAYVNEGLARLGG
jgi:hypothetical protein